MLTALFFKGLPAYESKHPTLKAFKDKTREFHGFYQ
jgi:hypothetical protein